MMDMFLFLSEIFLYNASLALSNLESKKSKSEIGQAPRGGINFRYGRGVSFVMGLFLVYALLAVSARAGFETCSVLWGYILE